MPKYNATQIEEEAREAWEREIAPIVAALVAGIRAANHPTAREALWNGAWIWVHDRAWVKSIHYWTELEGAGVWREAAKALQDAAFAAIEAAWKESDASPDSVREVARQLVEGSE